MHLQTISRKELSTLSYIITPLLASLQSDIENPIAAKVSQCISLLMTSIDCMNYLIEQNGLQVIAKVIDILMARKSNELKKNNKLHNQDSESFTTVMNLSICYREISRFYPWEIVTVGGIKHCVQIIKTGDVTLQTIMYVRLFQL